MHLGISGKSRPWNPAGVVEEVKREKPLNDFAHRYTQNKLTLFYYHQSGVLVDRKHWTVSGIIGF